MNPLLINSNGFLQSILYFLRHTVSEHILFALGFLLLFGYVFGKLAQKVKLPVITGYIVSGILLGESLGSIIEIKMVHTLRPITEIALGLIALAIGGEFSRAKLKAVGKNVFIMTVFQIAFTFILTSLALMLFGLEFEFALLLGAIASATAPAATIAIVQSLRARGKFVDYLYGLVALDDAGAVILFGIVFAFVGTLIPQQQAVDQSAAILIIYAFRELFLSIIIGIVAGYILHKATYKKQSTSEIMIISLGILLTIISLAHPLHISSLITNIVVGATLVNLSNKNQRISRILGRITPPIYAMFFCIAGIELELGIFSNPKILVLGIVFVLARMIGKYSGVFTGAKISHTDERTKKYLGVCMFPQAGVALGLVLLIQASPIIMNATKEIQLLAINAVNIVIFSVFINELVGPVLSKWAIIKGAKLNEY
ncbi:MAG: cation:proton antiporter [Candidatus Cloacimonadota bacterium]|nr:cation:proton antiporter [Candidatus Cloacimonadota bacterium]